jgi:hypothetical protein
VKSSDVGSSSRAEIVEVFNTLDADLDRLCELCFDVFVSDLIRMASHANHHPAVFHNGKALAPYLTSGWHPRRGESGCLPVDVSVVHPRQGARPGGSNPAGLWADSWP